MVRTVLVSGASIAGPAVAYWLSRQGFRVVVVEQAPALRPGGQTVDLRGAGRTVIERMGLLDEARAAAVDERGAAWVDERGRRVVRLPVELLGGEGLVAEIEVLRGDLARLLHTATRDDVEYVFGDRVVGLVEHDGGVDVRFAHGAPRTVDLVVGADGAHSGVRALAFGGGAPGPAGLREPGVRDLGGYTAWFSAPPPREFDGWFLLHNARGGRVATLRPVQPGASAMAGLTVTAPPQGLERCGRAAQQRLLADAFADVGWEVPRLLEAMVEAPDFAFDRVTQVRTDRWAAGRTILVGDAGYAPSFLTGLGTSLALVGAYVLAAELAAAGGDHQVAAARYTATMRPYVAQAQQLPPGGLAGFAPPTRGRIAVRDLVMRASTRPPFRALMARQAARADAVTLPDHRPVPVG